jgi:tetratricopeptide (TPR) repeat protein
VGLVSLLDGRLRSNLEVTGMALAASLLTGCSLGPASANPAPGAHVESSFSARSDRQIAQARELLRSRPDSVVGMNQLAQAYLQKVREVGDPSYYPKVESLLKAAIGRDPLNFDAAVLSGVLLLAEHRFREALEWGKKARELNPANAAPLGIITDASVELGSYDEATGAVQQMVRTRPDLSSYSRISYVKELHGDIEGAIQSMRDAVTAGGPYPENTAYVQVLLGNLYLGRGRLEEADSQYRQVLEQYPDYVHALASRGAERAAQGRLREAIQLYKRAVDIYPLPQYVIALGDVYALSGDRAGAARSYDLAAVEQQLYTANGVDLDQELALFDADHQRNLGDALAAARRAILDRPSVTSSDVLGWTLFQAGDYQAALAPSQQANRLGTQDALFFFHRGMIEARLGLAQDARLDLRQALAINPHFSPLHALEASQVLASIGG